jgi:ATP-binding cassette subfamily F protein uup
MVLATKPNVLVLDEPTNDLDLETLELLEAQLVDWPGTLLVVSHDRRFLDHVVTSTMAFEGDGRVVEYVGGYEDWVRQRPAAAGLQPPVSGLQSSVSSLRSERPAAPSVPSTSAGAPQPRKATNKEQRERRELPARIEALESEEKRLQALVASPQFYKKPAQEIADTLARLQLLPAELIAAYARWDELDGLR